MDIRNLNDFTDANAMGPSQMGKVNKTATTYNEPGLPKPPGGWGKKLGITDSERDERLAPDTREGEQ